MTTQNEEPNTYEFQSFDPFPKAQMFPTGWDLSEMQSAPEPVEMSASDESENVQM